MATSTGGGGGGGNVGVYDDHTSPHSTPTIVQLTLGIFWLVATIYTLLSACFGKKFATANDKESPVTDQLVETCSSTTQSKDEGLGERDKAQTVIDIKPEVQNRASGHAANSISPRYINKDEDAAVKKLFSKVPPPPDFNQLMNHVMKFGFFMFYFYLCDYVKVFPMVERSYVKDTFLFLVFMLFLVGCCFTIKPTSDKILNRDQTEEWKGWMQVMFVWYHYFAATEWYNWIRIYIAAYVWMTGFGNFSFFWVKKDFSPWRVMKMLFRLNFLVIFVCLTVKNEYMLYYICAMHTYWFLSVYAFMAVLPSWNTHRYRMLAKFTAYAIFNAIIFETPGLHMEIFRPFKFVFGFVDGRHDVMHEWAFRSGLDHWACFIGMLCAYNYPYFESLMQYLESASVTSKEKSFKLGAKVIMVTTLLCLAFGWSDFILSKEKYAYNAAHPYTSWIPIIVFIVIRNIHPVLRTHYVGLFAWLGKITLETYLSQLHIYLQSNAKDLIGYIPGYPLLNFSFSTIVYLFISHNLFNLTTEFGAWLFPKDYRAIARKCSYIFLTAVTTAILAYIMRHINVI